MSGGTSVGPYLEHLWIDQALKAEMKPLDRMSRVLLIIGPAGTSTGIFAPRN